MHITHVILHDRLNPASLEIAEQYRLAVAEALAREYPNAHIAVVLNRRDRADKTTHAKGFTMNACIERQCDRIAARVWSEGGFVC